jgi:hypothetical protein
MQINSLVTENTSKVLKIGEMRHILYILFTTLLYIQQKVGNKPTCVINRFAL